MMVQIKLFHKGVILNCLNNYYQINSKTLEEKGYLAKVWVGY